MVLEIHELNLKRPILQMPCRNMQNKTVLHISDLKKELHIQQNLRRFCQNLN